jgi:hypothetical protein
MILLLIVVLHLVLCSSFQIAPSLNDVGSTTRRVFTEEILKTASCATTSLAYLFSSSPAYASGGATAGGAYLLSAKQRYNKRVLAGIKSFLNLDTR